MALKPHLRRPDQPKTKIDVVYGVANGGKLEAVAQALRSITLLEAVAERMADAYAWPAPFAIEMQSCGYANASGSPSPKDFTVLRAGRRFRRPLSRLRRQAGERRAAKAAGALKARMRMGLHLRRSDRTGRDASGRGEQSRLRGIAAVPRCSQRSAYLHTAAMRQTVEVAATQRKNAL